MKKYRIGEDLLERGGGLLMLLDADDWVDRRLVESARARIGPEDVGAIIENGCAIDLRTLQALSLPDRRAFDIGFHRICGRVTSRPNSETYVCAPTGDPPCCEEEWRAATGLEVAVPSLGVHGTS